MDEVVMGIENELGVGVLDPANRPKLQRFCLNVLQELSKFTATVPRREGGSPVPGVMLANGSSIYYDGPHFIESATAESREPFHPMYQQRANELLVLSAVPQAAKSAGLPLNEVLISRISTDYCGKFAGAHLNVLLRNHKSDELVDFLVPFLVTRPYSCAGGLGATGFVNSHKARATRCVSGEDSRENRPICHLKNEPLAKNGFSRAHITFGDALMSDTSNFLTIGCTALVLMMLDKGASVGGAMALDDPLAAIRDLDTDPTWQKPLPLKCGTEMNAIQIQEHYLAACEAFVKNDPQPWPHEVVKRWRDVLNRLKKDPRMLATILDPYIKWVWYAGALRDHGLTFKQFSIWSSVLSLIRPHLSEGWIPRRSTKEWLRDQMPFVPFHLLEERLARHRLSWPDVPRALNVWNSLVALDLKYHSIFESGPFWTFRKTVPEAQLMCQAEIERAKSAPPAGTRAVRRSAAIREVSRDRKEAFANWTTVVDSSRSLDLSDPFKTDSSWQTARKTGVTK